MSKKGRTHSEDQWRNAKKICRLTVQQVEMARRLGMNPNKLPGLRPGPHQRWKLAVGPFIEECYQKRFGVGLAPGPEIPLSPMPTPRVVSRRGDPEPDVDDEIPF